MPNQNFRFDKRSEKSKTRWLLSHREVKISSTTLLFFPLDARIARIEASNEMIKNFHDQFIEHVFNLENEHAKMLAQYYEQERGQCDVSQLKQFLRLKRRLFRSSKDRKRARSLIYLENDGLEKPSLPSPKQQKLI